MADLSGFGLIFIALGLLIGPGVILNNFTNSNLVEPNEPNLTCPGWPDVTCQGSVATGCLANSPNPTPCTLQGTAFSFFNANSPFTNLLTGNIAGLFTSISAGTQAATHGPFDFVGGGPYLTANCIVYNPANATTVSTVNLSIYRCTQASSDGSNMSLGQTTTWNNWNTNFNTSAAVALHFYQFNTVSNATGYLMSCDWNAQFNYTQGIGGPVVGGYTWYGCDLYTQNGAGGACSGLFPPTVGCLTHNRYNSLLISIPFNQGAFGSAGRYLCRVGSSHYKCWHINVPVQLEGWETGICATTETTNRNTYSYLVSPQCDQWFANAKANAGASGSSWGILGQIVTFLFGLALFFLGFGINIAGGGSIVGTGSTLSIGSNPQGSKLAQVIGLGLVIWVVLYSEFATWFTSGILPYGFDGSAGIISIVITGLFWFGLYRQTTGGTTGE